MNSKLKTIHIITQYVHGSDFHLRMVMNYSLALADKYTLLEDEYGVEVSNHYANRHLNAYANRAVADVQELRAIAMLARAECNELVVITLDDNTMDGNTTEAVATWMSNRQNGWVANIKFIRTSEVINAFGGH